MSNDLGLDRSGNGNNWTVNNLAYSDQMVDSPTNNFATMNPLKESGTTLSEGNLKAVISTSGGRVVASTIAVSSGKWYAESVCTAKTINSIGFGVTNVNRPNASSAYGYNDGVLYYGHSGEKYVNGSTSSYGASFTSGDILGIALNLDDNQITFYKNGASQGVISKTFAGTYEFVLPNFTGSYTVTYVNNFGQDSSFAGAKTAQGNQDSGGVGDFYYTPPTGFLSLCTKNLPDVAVVPSENFNTVLFTGNGSTQTVTGTGFQPDWVWNKSRNTTHGHALFDAVRGGTRRLASESTQEERTNEGNIAFTSDGFNVTASHPTVNNNNSPMVSWNWKANGSGSSNTDGDVTSTVSANVDSGFSIVTYTGNGSNINVGHGLSKAPEIVIVKVRNDTGGWFMNLKNIPSQSAGVDMVGELNSSAAINGLNVGQWYFGSTAPTSSVFRVQNKADVGGNGENLVAYCFHSVDGYSSIGSYVGNGSLDGTFIYTGFRPAYVLVRRTDGSADWLVWDNARDTYNPALLWLEPNTTDAETAQSSAPYELKMDFVSNGFKLRGQGGGLNSNGATNIYIAFAESPFKYSNAR